MFGPCFVVQYFVSFLALQPYRCLLGLYCLAIFVLCFFLMVSWVGMWCVIVTFHGPTHLLFAI